MRLLCFLQGPFASDVVRIVLSSPKTPSSTYDINMQTGASAPSKVYLPLQNCNSMDDSQGARDTSVCSCWLSGSHCSPMTVHGVYRAI